MRVFRFFIEQSQMKEIERLVEILRQYSNIIMPDVINADTKFIDAYIDEQTKITKEFIENKIGGLNIKVDEIINHDIISEYHNLH